MATAAVRAPSTEGPRFYQPVPISSDCNRGYGGRDHNHYAVRGRGGHHNRVLARDFGLTWDQADRLCDLLEEVRRYALTEGVEA